MARILYHPRPVLGPDPPTPLFDDEEEPSWDRARLKDFMRAHSLSSALSSDSLGDSDLSAVHTRRPFVGELKTFPSPEDPETTFTFKRCGVRENIARRNLVSTVRYIQDEGSDRLITERDYPSGSLDLQTILFALVDWNIHDDNKNKITINEQTVQDWLSPNEYDFVLRMAYEVNPMWLGRGEEEVKNS